MRFEQRSPMFALGDGEVVEKDMERSGFADAEGTGLELYH